MHPIADITGANSTVQVTLPNAARFVIFVATGSGTARIGDATVTSSLGLPVAAGENLMLPECGQKYGATAIYAYVPSGCTLSVAFKD